jgi:hypothetical protein
MDFFNLFNNVKNYLFENNYKIVEPCNNIEKKVVNYDLYYTDNSNDRPYLDYYQSSNKN